MEFASGHTWSACSVAGTARDRNSDAFAVTECDGRLVVAVADGVGALEGSPSASRSAVHAAVRWGCDADLRDPSVGAQLVESANGAICAHFAPPAFSTGATTLVCLEKNLNALG